MDMFGQAPGAHADLLLLGGRVIDPAHGRDGVMDVAITNGRIAAVGDLAPAMTAARSIDARGTVITPGFIDMHVHVYEWVTNFGVPPDAAGIQSGVTTIVDQGSSGAWTFGGFKAFLADPARTDVRAFLSINVAGALQGGMEGTTLHNPGMVDVDGLVKLAAEHPRLDPRHQMPWRERVDVALGHGRAGACGGSGARGAAAAVYAYGGVVPRRRGAAPGSG